MNDSFAEKMILKELCIFHRILMAVRKVEIHDALPAMEKEIRTLISEEKRNLSLRS